MSKKADKKSKHSKPYKSNVLPAIIKSLKNGSTYKAACKAANIDITTLWMWRRDNPEIAKQIDVAVQSRIAIVEDALFKKAEEGNTTAMIFFLCNRAKDRWQNLYQIDHKGSLINFDKLLDNIKVTLEK